MKLIVEITTRDDKTEKHSCVDVPAINGDFITQRIRTETVMGMKQYFQGKPE